MTQASNRRQYPFYKAPTQAMSANFTWSGNLPKKLTSSLEDTAVNVSRLRGTSLKQLPVLWEEWQRMFQQTQIHQ